MNSSYFGNAGPVRSSPTNPADAPTRCPACQSRAISTTARNPDEHTYWRCDGCGEVWNAARREATRRGGHPWR
jgi:transposase-like protein